MFTGLNLGMTTLLIPGQEFSVFAATVPCGGKNAFSPDAGDLVGDVSPHIGTDDTWI